MRMHSALHLLCSLVPYGVTGGQISKEKSRLDFNAEDKMDRGKIEDEINKLLNRQSSDELYLLCQKNHF